jgi:hypothetical protein
MTRASRPLRPNFRTCGARRGGGRWRPRVVRDCGSAGSAGRRRGPRARGPAPARAAAYRCWRMPAASCPSLALCFPPTCAAASFVSMSNFRCCSPGRLKRTPGVRPRRRIFMQALVPSSRRRRAVTTGRPGMRWGGGANRRVGGPSGRLRATGSRQQEHHAGVARAFARGLRRPVAQRTAADTKASPSSISCSGSVKGRPEVLAARWLSARRASAQAGAA